MFFLGFGKPLFFQNLYFFQIPLLFVSSLARRFVVGNFKNLYFSKKTFSFFKIPASSWPPFPSFLKVTNFLF